MWSGQGRKLQASGADRASEGCALAAKNPHMAGSFSNACTTIGVFSSTFRTSVVIVMRDYTLDHSRADRRRRSSDSATTAGSQRRRKRITQTGSGSGHTAIRRSYTNDGGEGVRPRSSVRLF